MVRISIRTLAFLFQSPRGVPQAVKVNTVVLPGLVHDCFLQNIFHFIFEQLF